METQTFFLDAFFAKTLLEKKGLFNSDLESVLIQLMEFSRQGHLFCSLNELGPKVLELPSSIVQQGSDSAPYVCPIIQDQDRYYLQKNWMYEREILGYLEQFKKRTCSPFLNQKNFLTELELEKSDLLESQYEAIASVIKGPMTVISGGPGTGKTYTASKIVELFVRNFHPPFDRKCKVYLAAPTGKAASHLHFIVGSTFEEKADIASMTLHRLLNIHSKKKFKTDRSIDADLLIIDEASMIDVPLLLKLFQKIGTTTQFVLMGDENQLPPVDAISIFSDLAKIGGIVLNTSMRSKEPLLQKVASSIKEDRVEQVISLLQAGHSAACFSSWPLDETIIEKIYHRIDPIVSIDPPDPLKSFEKYAQFRVLGALRKGPFGVDSINHCLMERLYQKKKSYEWFAVPIFMKTNDPYLGIYNGTAGICIGQTMQKSEIYFFDAAQGILRLFETVFSFDLGFCLSIHKSQGSEFDEVLVLLPSGSENFGKECLYTAMTRSKKQVRICGSEEMVRDICRKRVQINSCFVEKAQKMGLA